jgi:hypothetical protein
VVRRVWLVLTVAASAGVAAEPSTAATSPAVTSATFACGFIAAVAAAVVVLVSILVSREEYTVTKANQNEALLCKIAVLGMKKSPPFLRAGNVFVEECKIPAWARDKIFRHQQGAFPCPEPQFSIKRLIFFILCSHARLLWSRDIGQDQYSLECEFDLSFFTG